jgi:hypothetical protein
MPYEVRKKDDGSCEVVNSQTGDVKAKHASCEDAERQVRLLHGIEHGWHPTGKEGEK